MKKPEQEDSGYPLVFDRGLPHCQHWSYGPSIRSPHLTHFQRATVPAPLFPACAMMLRARSALVSSNTHNPVIRGPLWTRLGN